MMMRVSWAAAMRMGLASIGGVGRSVDGIGRLHRSGLNRRTARQYRGPEIDAQSIDSIDEHSMHQSTKTAAAARVC